MKPKVNTQVYPIEIDGKEMVVGDTRRVHVDSHWNRSELVQITIEGKTYTVLGTDLIDATRNAMNVRSV